MRNYDCVYYYVGTAKSGSWLRACTGRPLTELELTAEKFQRLGYPVQLGNSVTGELFAFSPRPRGDVVE